MIGTRLFQKHYATIAAIVLLFIFIGSSITQGLIRMASEHRDVRPPLFFAKLIDELAPGDRIRAMKRLEELMDHDSPLKFALVGADGAIIYPTTAALPEEWAKLDKPERAYEARTVGAPTAPRPDGGRRADQLIRFPGEPVEYLLSINRREHGHGGVLGPAWFPILTFGSLILFVLLGIGLALALIFRSMRQKATLADSVIRELQGGNLKARFPITSLDEMGQAMKRFNQMADEIERLVDRLRSAEKSRMILLQELAHDLRTPVASLNNLLATIEKKAGPADTELRAELLSLARKEGEYFGRLVEDLLVLAQVSEPSYHANRLPLELGELLEDEAESVASQYEVQGKAIKLRKRLPDGAIDTQGDIHLLRRLFRNALDNAFSFASSEVTVTLSADEADGIRIDVEDDGPGVAAEALKSFGERKASRVLGGSKERRLSVGLGAVIMRTVAQLHRGSVAAENRVNAQGEVLGARVVICLPRSIVPT